MYFGRQRRSSRRSCVATLSQTARRGITRSRSNFRASGCPSGERPARTRRSSRPLQCLGRTGRKSCCRRATEHGGGVPTSAVRLVEGARIRPRVRARVAVPVEDRLAVSAPLSKRGQSGEKWQSGTVEVARALPHTLDLSAHTFGLLPPPTGRLCGAPLSASSYTSLWGRLPTSGPPRSSFWSLPSISAHPGRSVALPHHADQGSALPLEPGPAVSRAASDALDPPRNPRYGARLRDPIAERLAAPPDSRPIKACSGVSGSVP